MKQTITIVLPAHNESGNIIAIYDEIIAAMAQEEEGYSYSILFVDDGSTDDTLQIIKDLSRRDTLVKFVELSRNFGHQNAIKAGLDAAFSDIIIMMDCDLQHPPRLINDMLRYYEMGYDIVRTHRQESNDVSYLKRKTSSLFYKYLSYLSEIKLEQGSADFRLISGEAIKHLRAFDEFDLFYRGLIKWMGFKQISMEYFPEKRFSGETKYTYKKMISFGLKGFTSFSTKPLYFAAYIGLFFAVCSVLYLPYIFYALYTGHDVKGWASILASISFFGGLQLMILGVIGIYLSKLFVQSKSRPHYIVKSSNL